MFGAPQDGSQKRTNGASKKANLAELELFRIAIAIIHPP